ncbi:LysR family transcriptional regulator [Ferrimonas aestuarii]|uniref:LysR family transcriptional regulator n=2 Tax=Ferrimonas aestuarii TaxID=2569539 RepID=A0A4U1BMY7_9GAMM|nr:LysR family transcriptional regulator [Ferrimonas aestuarii]
MKILHLQYPMYKDLNRLDYFTLCVLVELFEQRSATVAAARLQTTQPKVSRALTSLREVFQDELFLRQQYGMVPNQLAETLYPMAKGIIEKYQELSATLSKTLGNSREINVAAQEHLSPILMAALHQARIETGQDFSFHLHPWTADVQKQMSQSQLDYCLAINPVPSNNIDHQPIGEINQFYLVSRKSHPIHDSPLNLDSLFDYPVALMNYSMSGPKTHRMEAFAAQMNLPLSVSMKSTDLNLILDHIENSDSIGFLASVMIKPAVDKRHNIECRDISGFFSSQGGSSKERPSYFLHLQNAKTMDGEFTRCLAENLKKRFEENR